MSDLVDDGLQALRDRARAQERLRRLRDRDLYEDSLIEFMRAAWRHVGETGAAIINWHHEVVADALVDVSMGRQRSLIINIPPRTTKTLICNVFWPAWIWAQPEERWGPLMGPHVRFLCVSYGATLSKEIAVKMRRLVDGEWYQSLWGDRVSLREDQQDRANFGNTAGGERISTSVEGGILGRGGDIQCWDDPQNPKQAESEAERRQTIEALRNLATRVTDPRRSARVLVAQRLQEQDATWYALEHWDRPKHIMLPMRYDTRRGALVPEDPREEDGELLWPKVWTERLVRQEEGELLEYNTAAQLQQAPIPRGGGIIKREWWRLWPDDAEREGGVTWRYRCDACDWERALPSTGSTMECPSCGRIAERVVEFPPYTFRLLSVDTAFGEKEANSYSAATLWSIFHDADEAPRAILTEAWRGRPKLRSGSMKTGERGLVEQIFDMALRRRVDVVVIEKKTRGRDLYDELAVLLTESGPAFRLDFWDPTGRGDKAARLNSTAPLFTNDLIWAPDKRWADMVIDEVCSQTPDGRARENDLSDTVSMALIYLRQYGLLKLKHEFTRQTREAAYFQGRSIRMNTDEVFGEA